MVRCTTCNWSPHDVSVHGALCINGHPRSMVGTYVAGRWTRCAQCQRDASRRYADRHREQERRRSRRWYLIKRPTRARPRA